MRELLTAFLFLLRWSAYAMAPLLLPGLVLVPVVLTVARLPVGRFTAAGLSGLGLLITLALIRMLWRRYARRSDSATSGRHHQRGRRR
ncbi:MAG TPA: hypothetical protein VFQ48_05715 [Pseudonocardiaceae bacterium]|nr:hypothetical protein [Pseudonocardiaceae bacterium]